MGGCGRRIGLSCAGFSLSTKVEARLGQDVGEADHLFIQVWTSGQDMDSQNINLRLFRGKG